MIEAVVDGRLLMNGILVPGSLAAEVVECGLEGTFNFIVSPQMMEEIRQATRQPELMELVERCELSTERLDDLLCKLVEISMMTSGMLSLKVAHNDPEDDMFLTCAIEGQADYIVSNDGTLRNLRSFQGIPIITPAQFLKIIKAH